MNPWRLSTVASAFLLLAAGVHSYAAQMENRIVRLAELDIDPARLDAYKAELKEEIETSIRIEPGVMTLFAVAAKENPAHITILEVYADAAAYKAHLATAHFLRYKAVTQDMVKSLRLIETDPIILGAKP